MPSNAMVAGEYASRKPVSTNPMRWQNFCVNVCTVTSSMKSPCRPRASASASRYSPRRRATDWPRNLALVATTARSATSCVSSGNTSAACPATSPSGGAGHRRDHVAALVERDDAVRVVQVLVDVGVAVGVVDAAAHLDRLLLAQRADLELRTRSATGKCSGASSGAASAGGAVGDGRRRQVLDDHRLLAAAAEVVELHGVGEPLHEEAAEAGAGLALEVGAGVVLGRERRVVGQALVVHGDLDAGGHALAGDVEAPALVAAERAVDDVGGRLLQEQVEAAQLLGREPGLTRVLAHEPLHHRQEGERAGHAERAAPRVERWLRSCHVAPAVPVGALA